MTHHELTQKKTSYSFTGTCACGRWSQLILGRDRAAQATLLERYNLHKQQAKTESDLWAGVFQ